MARKKKEEVKRPRMRVKRERKPRPENEGVEDRTWIVRSKHRAMAVAILNGKFTFSFWASMEKDGRAIVSSYYPACHFEWGGRVYYGFAFRHHREDFVELHCDARKEYTEVALDRLKRSRTR